MHIDPSTWNTDYLPSEIFDLTIDILKQADSTIEDIYNSYYKTPSVDYSWMDTSKEVTVGCNGWGNQQPWTDSWLLKCIHSDSNKRALSLLCVHAHSSCTVTKKELDILHITPSNKALKIVIIILKLYLIWILSHHVTAYLTYSHHMTSLDSWMSYLYCLTHMTS